VAEAQHVDYSNLQGLEATLDRPHGKQALAASTPAPDGDRAREQLDPCETLFQTRCAPRPQRRSGVALRRRSYDVSKRVLDVSLVLLALPFALPLLTLCAALIWITDGRPLFFAQERTGRAGRRFRFYKLRTMVKDAAARKHELMDANEQSGPDFKIAQDPRITPLGAFLRKYSLDELPQLANVLLGQMSLVGPRPTSFEAASYDLWHTERLEILPGLTGLWQISGRAQIDFDTRVRLDVEYIERRSLLFDAWILVQTVREVVRPRGAF
jgi:lipopolysaccharide/colanic/teichoic acid biosynthesis glycosyltransferase